MINVAILMPVRNEEEHLRDCIESIIANDYPKDDMMMLIIDGMSTDRTKQIAQEYVVRYSWIKYILNTKISKPCALNLGIKETQSNIVMRIDAHAIYAQNYISGLVNGLFKYEADNIGGVRDTHRGDGLIKSLIGCLVSSPFAAGDAHYRTGTKGIRRAKTVFGGCYRRDIFNRIGLFNEKLIRVQDRELNFRLVKHGGKIVLDSSVRCLYFPRTSLVHYLGWVSEGAYWLIRAKRFTRTPIILIRNYVPLFFMLYLFTLPPALIYLPAIGLIIALAPLIAYGLLNIYYSILAAIEIKRIQALILSPIIFLMTHLAYGIGAMVGIAELAVKGRDIDE